jgi:hypothetical protein
MNGEILCAIGTITKNCALSGTRMRAVFQQFADEVLDPDCAGASTSRLNLD